MAAENHGLTRYPGDIEEQEGKLPLFLKLTYAGFLIFGIVYLVIYFSGDGSPLVEQFNQMAGNAVP